MAYEQKDNTGSLFKNDYKKSEKQPDYKGSALIGGTEYAVSAWLKDGKKGKYFSFSYKRKDEMPQKDSVPTKHISSQTIDDEIPF